MRSQRNPDVHFVFPLDEKALTYSIKNKTAWNEHTGYSVVMDGKVVTSINALAYFISGKKE